MSVHDGHRERMRRRFLKEGFDHFEPHEVLEILLYYCIPRTNTNEIAHRLIQRYKTVGRVLRTAPEELKSFEGIGDNAAFFLKLLNEANRYINTEESVSGALLYDVQDYGNYLAHLFDGMNTEALYMVCLDAKCTVLGNYKISEGSATSTSLPVRDIVSHVLNSHAASVILAHNHPGGFSVPSEEDRALTLYLSDLLKGLDVVLVDHLVFSGMDFVSLMDRGPKRINRAQTMYL